MEGLEETYFLLHILLNIFLLYAVRIFLPHALPIHIKQMNFA